MPDHRYCYSLTQAGIYYTDQEVIPDAAYTFVRGFAWVGIAVCLLALAVVGPLAFVGAGGFALLAFGLTNFHPTVHKKEVYFADQLIVFDPIKEKMVDLNTDSTDEPWFDRRLFFSSLDEKTHFIELVKSIHNNVDYLPLQRVNDQYKHPIFNQELKRNSSELLTLGVALRRFCFSLICTYTHRVKPIRNKDRLWSQQGMPSCCAAG